MRYMCLNFNPNWWVFFSNNGYHITWILPKYTLDNYYPLFHRSGMAIYLYISATHVHGELHSLETSRPLSLIASLITFLLFINWMLTHQIWIALFLWKILILLIPITWLLQRMQLSNLRYAWSHDKKISFITIVYIIFISYLCTHTCYS